MNDYLCENIELILNRLDIEYKIQNKRITFPCPIHQSGNDESLSILIEGEKVNGLWSCWSNGCHELYGKTIFGLIKGVLSQTSDVDNSVVFKWIKNNIGDVPKEDVSLSNYLNLVTKTEEKKIEGIDRKYVRSSLSRPVDFLLQRRYSESIIDKYDIGICKQKKQMFMRVVIPVYDENHSIMVGCLGRSINEQCPKCKMFHYKQKNCPTNNLERRWSEKWINSNFYAGDYLFNLWYAKKHIYETGSIILVEGPLDVLRLEEAGIHNSVALFGTSLKQKQHDILNQLPIHTLIISTDNDIPGKKAAENIENQTGRYFNIKKVFPIKKDWGEHNTEEIGEIWKNKK